MNYWMVDISLWAFPASLILATAFALGIWAADRYSGNTRLVRLLSNGRTAVTLLCLAAAVLAIEGVWALGLYHTLPFVFLMLLLAASLGLTTLHRLRTRHDTGFVLNHAGLFLVIWAMLFGAPDRIEGRMIVHTGTSESLAYTPTGKIIPLPFEVLLDHFAIDYYDDGHTPRQFRSKVRFDTTPAQIAVNSPARYGGYTFYQDSYDTRKETYTVLLITRDPWQWVVWCGAAMMAAGACILLFRKR